MIVGDVFFGQKRFGHEVTFANLREHREASIRRSEEDHRRRAESRGEMPWSGVVGDEELRPADDRFERGDRTTSCRQIDQPGPGQFDDTRDESGFSG